MNHYEVNSCLIEERVSGHVKDVHFNFSVTNLHSDNTHNKTQTFQILMDSSYVSVMDAADGLNLLCDAIVNTDSGQVLGNKPLLTVAFDDAALGENNY